MYKLLNYLISIISIIIYNIEYFAHSKYKNTTKENDIRFLMKFQ